MRTSTPREGRGTAEADRGERLLAWAYRPIGLAVDAVLLIAVAALPAATSGLPVPTWWPAAAVAALALAWAPAGRRAVTTAVVAVALVAGHLPGDRPVALAVGLGLAATAEAVLVAHVLVWRRGPAAQPRLVTLPDVARFVLAVHLGVLVMATGAALSAAATGAVHPLAAFGSAIAAHGAALLVLVPFGLRMPAPALTVPAWQVGAHLAGLVAVTAVVFWPGHWWPLAFLTVPLLVWAAMRLTPRLVAVHLLALGVVAGVLTYAGGGPFSAAFGLWQPATVAVLQAFVVVSALVAGPLAISLTQRRSVVAQLRASERLLRSGFDDSLLGMLLLRRCRPGHAEGEDEAAGAQPGAGAADGSGVRAAAAAGSAAGTGPAPGADGARLTPAGHDGRGLDVVELNGVAARMFGRAPEAIKGASWTSVVPPATRDRLVQDLDAMSAGEIPGWHGELLLETVRGGRWVEVAIAPADQDGLFAAQVVDVTARREAEQRLVTQAMTDPLTGLANRTVLRERVSQALSDLGPDATVIALELDLDHFKRVNDSAGHPVGDEVLLETAARLTETVRPGDLVARLGGDEFVVLCAPGTTMSEATALADQLLVAVRRPVQVRGTAVRPGASIGIAAAGPGAGADDLLRDADTAMYAAKASGRGRSAVFADEHRARAERLLRLEAELREALDHEQLRVHWQPVVDLTSGRPVAAEALVRWQHPVHGLLAPGEWLDVAEQSGLMPQLGAWVLRRSLEQAATWPGGADGPVHLHVNVSARQLEAPGFVSVVAGALAATGVAPERLLLEVTETQLDDVSPAITADLVALRALGVGLAADDFGTGYSPLTRIIDLPLTMVKVDRRFVDGMLDSPRNEAVVRLLLRLSETLGLVTVAEGVERPEQAAALRAEGATHGQGYLWSRPITPDELVAWLSGRAREQGR